MEDEKTEWGRGARKLKIEERKERATIRDINRRNKRVRRRMTEGKERRDEEENKKEMKEESKKSE